MAEYCKLLLSCEHGGNTVPAAYRGLFQAQEELLASHRGYDRGSLPLARFLAQQLNATLEYSTTTRLLVDLNRSRSSKSLFSEVLAEVSAGEKEQILARYYDPYRNALRDRVGGFIDHGAQVVHLSVHTFTPVLHGQPRSADLGLLYDPSRNEEKRFCRDWQDLLQQQTSDLRVRCNYPYRGTADGLTRSFRQFFPAQDYLGIELEVNQALLAGNKTFPEALQKALSDTLRDLLIKD